MGNRSRTSLEGEFCREKEELQRQVFKEAGGCHTSKKSRNTQRAEEAAFIWNKRAGNEAYSRDAKRGWKRKYLHTFSGGWRGLLSIHEGLQQMMDCWNHLPPVLWSSQLASNTCCKAVLSFRWRLWNEESCSFRWSSNLHRVGGCWSAVMHCVVFAFTGVPTA